jgi:ribosomal protein L11 methyltransferase
VTPGSSVATLLTDEQSARRVADLMAESIAADEGAVSLVEKSKGVWAVAVYFGSAPDEKAVRALAVAAAGPQAGSGLRFERIAAKDWVGESLAGLKPVAAGRFIVHGAHDRAGIPVNRIGIEIEAALAFGTGHHGTTRGCLLALDSICKGLSITGKPLRIFDLGTGSGVLAVAAARALRRRVIATDIDRNSARAARDNARLNCAGPLIAVVTANGVTAPPVRSCAPFDLVFANILLKPLQRLATPLTGLIAPGGRLILSGIMTSQANATRAAYHSLTLEKRIDLDGWTTLVMRRGRRLD